MPFSRQTLTQLQNQVMQDLSRSAGLTGSLLKKAILKVVGNVQAGLAHLHYGYLDWISKQAVPYTATDEYAQAWGALKNVVLKDATAASGVVTISGATAGTIVDAGTVLVRTGDSATFTTTEAVTVASDGTVLLPAKADATGADGNMDAGVSMVLQSSIDGVPSTGTVTTAFTGGADVESDDEFTQRMLAAYQVTPQGGCKDDYVTWAESVSGVTRAWCRRNGFGTGTVVVYVMLDDAESAHGGFPQGSDGVATDEPRGIVATGDQLTVADVLYPLQPVTALVYVCAPVASPVAFTLSGVPTASQTAVTAALADVFTQESSPGGTTNTDGTTTGTIPLLDFWQAVSAVTGMTDFVIQSPSADISAGIGEMPVLGTVTYL